MGNLAVHMRITSIEVTDDIVDTRNSAIADLVEAWGKLKRPEEIIVKAAQIAQALGGDGTPGSELGQEVETSIQKYASAFLASERPLEIGICAGVAISKLLEVKPDTTGWRVHDVFAMALWLALEFQPSLSEAKRETLRTQVLNLARSSAIATGDSARLRLDVPDFPDITITLNADKITSTFKKATTTTINALRRNAALDREELDFLWWVQSNRSRLLNRPLTHIDEPLRLIVMGVEAAELLRRLPAEVHREIVLRTVNEDPSLDIKGILTAVSGDLNSITDAIPDDPVAWAPAVFPLLHALTTGSDELKGSELTRPSSEWGVRALLEATFANLLVDGIGTL